VSMMSIFKVQAVNFFCFDMYRKAFLKAMGPELRNEAKVSAGALAGEATLHTITHFCTYGFWGLLGAWCMSGPGVAQSCMCWHDYSAGTSNEFLWHERMDKPLHRTMSTDEWCDYRHHSHAVLFPTGCAAHSIPEPAQWPNSGRAPGLVGQDRSQRGHPCPLCGLRACSGGHSAVRSRLLLNL